MASQIEPSRRRGRFRALVNDFNATLADHQMFVPVTSIEELLADQITLLAERAGITEHTALRSYVPDTWGQDMALRLVSQRADDRRATIAADARVPTRVLLRALAALGQAQLFAAVNTREAATTDRSAEYQPSGRSSSARSSPGPRSRPPRLGVAPPSARYDAIAAAHAVSALALALHDSPPGHAAVAVDDLAAARDALAAAVNLLAGGLWVTCHCCELAEQQELITELLERFAADRADLALYMIAGDAPIQPAGPATPSPEGTVIPLRPPRTRRR